LNSSWNSNIRLFRARFPGLHELYAPLFTAPPNLPDWELLDAKSGDKTLREQGGFLHSAYNPVLEADKIVAALVPLDSLSDTPLVFYGFGLGYVPIAAAKQFPKAPIALIENDPARFALALRVLDWEPVLTHRVCVLLINAPEQNVLAALEGPLFGGRGLESLVFVDLPAVQKHAGDYFALLKELIRRNIQKERINRNTLKKFGPLWNRNSHRNAEKLQILRGVCEFAGTAKGRRACVIGAGPSLEGILPLLKDIQKQCVLVCVDTALRSLLGAGVEPDFILVGDAQFWNSRHMEGLASLSSTLITEITAYPPVFRFPCKEIVLFDSVHPVEAVSAGLPGPGSSGKPKGILGAGGSVATSAWDFARRLGCAEIFLAGVDLAFPHKRSHARGSAFEQQSHRESARLAPAETFGTGALFSANSQVCRDYQGNPLLSDDRLRLYAWWFESKIAANPQVKTWSLTAESSAIPGAEYYPLGKFLGNPALSRRQVQPGL
jgi:hypothetical protein